MQAAQDILHRLDGNVGSQKRVYLIRAQCKHRLLGNGIYDIYNAVNDLTRAEQLDQLTGSVNCREGVHRVKPLFKLRRSLGAHTQRQSTLADAGAVEVRRLKHNIHRIVNDLAVLAAHDAGKTDGAGIIGDYEDVGVELSDIAVERRELLALICTANYDPAALDVAIVKRVHRLAVLHHDIVCDIDDVVYRSYAHCAQSLAHPLRRGCDLYVAHHACGISRAEVGCRGLDRQKLGKNAVRSAPDDGGMGLELLAEGCRRLTRKTDDRQTVGTVGRYLKLDDMIVCAYNGLYIVAGLYAVLVKDEYTVGYAVGEFRLLSMQISESADTLGFSIVRYHVAGVDVLTAGCDSSA